MRSALRGVAAILRTPMRGAPYMLGAPSPLGLVRGARLLHGRHNVGDVTRVRVEDGRLLWEGHLHPIELVSVFPDNPLSIPVPRYPIGVESARNLISGGRMVAVPHVVQGEETRVSGRTLISSWVVEEMVLLPADAAPWEGLELHLAQEPAPPAPFQEVAP